MKPNSSSGAVTAETLAKLGKVLREMSLTSSVLRSDVNRASEAWKAAREDQFWRRNVVRCVFAFTEALLWYLRRTTPILAEVSNVTFSEDELLLLEERRKVRRSGVDVLEPKYLRFQDGVKFTFQSVSKALGVVNPDFGQVGFQALCKTSDLRNRIMHPKSLFDLEVTDQSIKEAQEGLAWLVSTFEQVSQRHRELHSLKRSRADGRG